MEVLDVLLGPGEKIVDANNLVAVAEQAINQMRAEKSGTAGDQDAFAAIIDMLPMFCSGYSVDFLGYTRTELFLIFYTFLNQRRPRPASPSYCSRWLLLRSPWAPPSRDLGVEDGRPTPRRRCDQRRAVYVT